MPDRELEDSCLARGCQTVAGVDEVGRGPLAGPVVAGAAILPPGFFVPGLDDSKKLSEKKRNALYEALTSNPEVRWSVAIVDWETIDRINILKATHQAMAQAVEGLGIAVCHCLIDGLPVPNFPYPHDGIVKGDAKSISIAAASIVAKVTRDRLMKEAAVEFPQYGFDRHMGYGTPEHLEALRIHGPCRIHRRSFQPVAQLTLSFGEA